MYGEWGEKHVHANIFWLTVAFRNNIETNSST